MSCRFCDFEGKCDLWDPDGVQFEHISNSCDEEGHCLVEEDADPSMSCEDYQE